MGLVTGIGPGVCHVLRDGRAVTCALHPDLIRRQQTDLAVGDRVWCEDGAGPWTGPGAASVVRQVLPRTSRLSRRDPGNPHRERVIAANVDLAVIVGAAGDPPLHPTLIDRYLVALGQGGVKPVICLNKGDLAPAGPGRDRLLERLSPYRGLGIPVVVVSAVTGEGLAGLRGELAGRMAVFVGHSGVGKSSLLNALEPGLDLAVNGLRRGDGKGRHTTTGSTLYRLSGGITVIDTPGIREFGLWRMTPADLRHHFAEFAAAAHGCRFGDCTHLHEPGCAVRAGVAQGRLPRERYQSYRKLLGAPEGDDPFPSSEPTA